MSGGIGHQHAGQRSNFHRMVLVARCLKPGVLLLGLQMLKRWFRSGVLGASFALIGMLRVLITVGILIPGMSNVLRYIGRINRIHLGKITVEDGATGYVKAGGILDAALGIIAIREEIPQSLATPEPVAIKAGDGQHIRNIDLVNEGLP